MANPSISGPFLTQKAVYAAPGLVYPSPALDQYKDFENPTAGFDSRRIDVSAFADLGAGTPWPFPHTDVPLNGLLWFPQQEAACPLVLVAHGNHSPFENSTPGYDYLCDHLATHGMIAASIDVNFLNGFNFGENDGRAIVQLEHIRLFTEWNADPDHPLFGRIDTENILIVGHSRGGEAVGHASLFNRLPQIQPDPVTPPVPLDGSMGLGPYRFNIRGAVAIAPTDRQYVPMTGPTQVLDNYYLFHGSRDNDVFTFPGYRTYDRSHQVDLSDPLASPEGYKSLLWVHQANHNFFNSVWQQDALPATQTLTRQQQEQICITAITSLARAEFFTDQDGIDFVEDHQVGVVNGWLPRNVKFVSQHHGRDRTYVQHSQEPGNVLRVSAPIVGTVSTTDLTGTKEIFDLGSSRHLFQETSGVRLDWQMSTAQYVIEIDPQSINVNQYSCFAFRIGQSFEPNNPAGQDQNFTIIFEDNVASVSGLASSFHQMIYPDSFSQIRSEPKTVMQSFRLPLSELRRSGLMTRSLRRIRFLFDQIPTGTLYLDDIEFRN